MDRVMGGQQKTAIARHENRSDQQKIPAFRDRLEA